MKNKTSFCVIVLVLAMALTGCKSNNKKPGDNLPGLVTYEKDATLPDYKVLPLHIYQTSDSAKIDEATAMKNIQILLQAAGADKEFDLRSAVKENGMLWYKNPKDPSAILNINLANGDISLNRGMLSYSGNNNTPDLIKNEEAVKIATKIIQTLAFAKGEENSMITGHVGGVNMTIHDDKDGDKIYEKLTTVRFDRKLDNIAVLGHTRLLLQLGAKGAIQSLIKQWTPLTKTNVDSVSVAGNEDIKKAIEDNIIRDNNGAAKIIIKKINLIYYDIGKGIIEPAIHVIAEVQMPPDKTGSPAKNYKHDMVLPLLKNYRLSYTFKGENHTMPKEKDSIDNSNPVPRGKDEKQ